MKLKNIADFCRRTGIVTRAGIGIVDTIKREAIRQSDQKLWSSVVASLENGESLTSSLQPFQKQFGEMFIAMIEMGEESGNLSEMFVDLADYYDDILRIRRDFLKSLILPIIELAAAVFIIGLIILIQGLVSEMTGNNTFDILGFGLIGFNGFVKYWIYVGVFSLLSYFLFLFISRNVRRMRVIHYFLNSIPKIGNLMRSLAYMRLCWGLNLTMGTGMDVERALKLSFNCANYSPVSDNLKSVLEIIRNGGNLTEGFSTAKNIDYDLVGSIETGEYSGSLPELMQKMTNRYFQESLLNLRAVSVVGGFVVYGIIMAIVILLIFRIASFYIGILNGAVNEIGTIMI
ncbi:MAG: type II secretion system F family protein [Planctomycetaceae bacterium]|jgi:type IV pilus assembly protein PilC|nr:type II secretion system F family protein [Planctomycetaceae bacterium]